MKPSFKLYNALHRFGLLLLRKPEKFMQDVLMGS